MIWPFRTKIDLFVAQAGGAGQVVIGHGSDTYALKIKSDFEDLMSCVVVDEDLFVNCYKLEQFPEIEITDCKMYISSKVLKLLGIL